MGLVFALVPPAPVGSETRGLPPLAPAPADGLTASLARREISDAEYALARARSLFDLKGTRAKYGGVAAPDPRAATLILRDLKLRLGLLSGEDRQNGERVFQRPDDGRARDPASVKYRVPSRFLCAAHLCVHFVDSTEHAPPAGDADGDTIPDWVQWTAYTFEQVWKRDVFRAGFRAPKSDLTSRKHGPDGRLDIYLADLGSGFFGYCTSDDPNAAPQRDVSAFCVVDNDFNSSQFPYIDAVHALRIAASHEFFHAIQFAYDISEDPWLMEGTAVWAEDYAYDGINDNLRYVETSPLRYPRMSIDDGLGMRPYGAWIFFRFLSEQFSAKNELDPTIIREIWDSADARRGAPNRYSILAVEEAVSRHGAKFGNVLSDFGVWNYFAGSFYEEGASYRTPILPRIFQISRLRFGLRRTRLLRHLSTEYVVFRPAGARRRAALDINLDAPPLNRGPAAKVILHLQSGRLRVIPLALDSHGDATTRVQFGRSSVYQVILVLTNASTRFNCWKGTLYSCQGKPTDERLPFRFQVRLVR
ncbi:MAG: MXAN_6640 family putative metalloprotease [Actinomycetota bacterium]